MTQSLIEKLEEARKNSKPLLSSWDEGVVAGLNQAMFIIRQHAADEGVVEALERTAYAVYPDISVWGNVQVSSFEFGRKHNTYPYKNAKQVAQAAINAFMGERRVDCPDAVVTQLGRVPRRGLINPVPEVVGSIPTDLAPASSIGQRVSDVADNAEIERILALSDEEIITEEGGEEAAAKISEDTRKIFDEAVMRVTLADTLRNIILGNEYPNAIITKLRPYLRTEQVKVSVEAMAKRLWQRDYPHGGLMHRTYESTNNYDKILYRKEIIFILESLKQQGVDFQYD